MDPARQFASGYLYAGNGANPIVGIDPDGNQMVGVSIRAGASTPSGWSWRGGATFSLMFDFGRLMNGDNPMLYAISADGGMGLSTGGGTLSAGFFGGGSPKLGGYVTPTASVVACEGAGIGGNYQSGSGRMDLGLFLALGSQVSAGGGMETGYIGEVNIFQETTQIPFESDNSGTYIGSTSSELSSSSSVEP